MNKHYYVTQRVRLYGRSYEAGEVIEADDADVADLVGRALKEAQIVDQGETTLGDPGDPPAPLANADTQTDQGDTQLNDDAQTGQTEGQSDAGSDSADSEPAAEPAVQPAVKKAAPVVKKSSTAKGKK